ncbi:MAG TPA: SusD/RagB family nutrient-binding outer membrane lipoprotein [Chryseolinea sp.]|nr:SusD/RagB family nutrient-binding outer membrane lipoprotein [Chryseolinea sp.]
MKKFKDYIKMHGSIALLCSIVVVMSCTDKFEEYNTNKNKLSKLEPSQLPFLFSKAQSTATNNGWNYQIAQNLFHDQYCQYFANTTTYFPSDRLVIRMDWIRAAWNPIYTEVVPQLQSIMEATEPTSPEYALANIMWVYSFHRLTDTWGPVPYFSAGQAGVGVPYDDQDLIYDDMFKRLADAVSVLDGYAGQNVFSDYDLIYGGDVNKWKKFANTLRLRLAIRISGVDATRAKTEGEAAAASGTLTASPGDDALIKRSLNGDDFNGLAIMDWNEFRMSSTMESVLKGYNDPRMPIYFMPTRDSWQANEKANGKPATEDMANVNFDDLAHPMDYNGLRNGLSSADMAAALNNPSANSHHGERWNDSDGLETPSNVMAASEADFLKAEATLLGWSVGGGTAKQHYENGIRNSLAQWGITDAAVVNAYISSAATPIAPGDAQGSPAVSTAPVAFGATVAQQKEQITIQKWLALYPEGVEAWADLRRSRAFKIYPVKQSDNPDLPTAANINAPTNNWIRRIPFINDEKVTNGSEVTKAVPLLNGPDNIVTKLWWDVNP